VKALIAPQAFKGSLSAVAVAEAMAAGLPAGVTADRLPVADGGEGTVDALLAALGGELRTAIVEDPLGRQIEATWGLLPDGRAALEMAAASGLPLLAAHERDPRRATTFGTGQLIAAALDSAAGELLIGIGGSATNDGGAFALQALGARLLDSEGKDLPRSVIHLQRLARIDLSGLHRRLSEARLRVMCDVTNPLLGPDGATAIYGPQKGVNPPMHPRLEAALERWAEVLERETGRRLRDEPGAGAAGGLGFALLGAGARLEPGAELILNVAGFDQQLIDADLVITGEGRLDGQSLFGKATVAVARRARKAGVPVAAIVGSLGEGWEGARKLGFDPIVSIMDAGVGIDEAQGRAAELITAATARAFRMIESGKHASRPRRQ
jgi:glycerate kinase